MILWTFSSRNNPEEEGKQKSIELLDIPIKSNYLRANSCVIPVPSFSLKWREQFSCEKLFFELINFFFLVHVEFFHLHSLTLFFFFEEQRILEYATLLNDIKQKKTTKGSWKVFWVKTFNIFF